MSVTAQLTHTLSAVRQRVAAIVWLCALPLVAGAAMLAWRFAGVPWAAGVALVGLGIGVMLAARRAARYDRAWLIRSLDAGRADMDDSAALVFARTDALGALQRLQQVRLQARLAAAPWTPAQAPVPKPAVAAAWICGGALIAAAIWWPPIAPHAAAQTRSASQSAAVPGAPVLQSQSLRIVAPAYTGQTPRTQAELDAQAPAGATLRWTLRFAPQPQHVALRLHDDREIAFVREGEDWVASLRLDQSWLYRIAVDGDTDHILTRAQPWRLDAVPDRPPEVRVRAPQDTLSTYTRGERAWALAFEASDDHGVSPSAQLRITVTRGSGEAITFEDRSLPLRGRGDARAMTFATTIDPVALGLEEGGDLIAQLEVRDNRVPSPQIARSPSLILRWPPPKPLDADGLEGLARDVLPAYFRSQRQIIIDAEALIAEQARLESDAFETRSDALGVDQRILRLRYGQFLGEESEDGPRPPPTADAQTPPPARKPLPIDDFGQTDTPAVDAHDADARGHDDETPPQGAGAHDDHAHDAAPQDATTFGRADDVLATYGHTHDVPEAATLLDPKTREILRGALQAMWQSELHLRQFAPREALPHANRALVLIKQVQEADRIYLARVGTSLPPVDPARRLGGDREDIAPRAVPAPSVDTDTAPATAWRALAWDEAPDLAALIAWAQAHPRQVDDPLALLAAVDALRRDAACVDCRQALRGQLWRVLQRPLPAPARRAAPDALGVRWLDALQEDAP